MFRHVLLDFLVPSSVRWYSQANPFPLHAASPAALFAKLRSTIPSVHAHSPSLLLPPNRVHSFNKSVNHIRRALREENNAAIIRHWRSLEKQNILPLLGHAHLVPLSTLMVQSFLQNRRTIEPQILKMAENLALLTARADSFHALNALMWYHLRRQEPEAVLNLYHRFMTLIGDRDLILDDSSTGFGQVEDGVEEGEEEEVEEVGEMDDMLATDQELRFSRVQVPPERTQMLLAAVAAHALQDSFNDALNLYLATAILLPPPIDWILQTFGSRTRLRPKMRDYLSRLRIAKLVSRQRLSPVVKNFGDARAKIKLQSLYQSLMDCLSGPDPFLAADPSLVTDTRTMAVTRASWTSLLVAFMKCNRKDMVAKLWDDMTALGVPPDVSMWTALIDAYDDIRATDDALHTWNMMLSQGIKPSPLAYRAIISALFRGRRPEHAMEMFDKYQATQVDLASPEHLTVCNTVLHGLCAADRVSQAEALREEMGVSGIKLDLVSFNTFIDYYGRRGQFKAIATILKAMKDARVEGDVFTFTTILSALLKVGRTDASGLVLELMDKQGVKRNVALYTALIDHQLREGGRQNLQVAMRMLQRMEQDPANPPNDVTYTSILTGLYRLSWISPQELERWQKDIIARVQCRGLVFGLPAYHLLLKACLVYPHENGVRQALVYFEEMKQQEIPIINTTWYILLAGMLTRGEWEVADKLVREMYASGHHPTRSLLRLVHKINNRVVEGTPRDVHT